jgi:hypothetical protein
MLRILNNIINFLYYKYIRANIFSNLVGSNIKFANNEKSITFYVFINNNIDNTFPSYGDGKLLILINESVIYLNIEVAKSIHSHSNCLGDND